MTDPLHRQLASLEGAESALVLASGRAAVACTVLALLRPGDHLLACTWLRPETRQFFEQELPALGVEVSYVDPRETRGWRRGLKRTTRALFIESPVFESGRLIDLKPPRTLSQELGIALIADSTAASPINFTPIAHGVDVVVHDAAVFLDDQAEGAAGVVCGTEMLVEEVRHKMAIWGALPHPAASQQLEHGLATLEVRVARQNSTAQLLAEWAGSHPAIAAVSYAGLSDHPEHDVLLECFRGAGATVHVQLVEPLRVADVSYEATLAMDDTASTRRVRTQFSASALPGWMRLQVGLEPVDAIIDAVTRAIAAAAAGPQAPRHDLHG